MASSLLDPAVDGTPVLDVELPDFTTEAYKSAYSRINAIVIEGEQEAHDNYIS
ncbi:MAG: long-chain fatty aldehyde decarbonylase, partial [Synechococcus sp.]